jgi:hypothetical protein
MGVVLIACLVPSTSLLRAHVSLRQKKIGHPLLLLLRAREWSVKGKMLARLEYYLDIALLRRQEDGTFVAAFSVQGARREGIVEAAKEDYQKLIEANAQSSVGLYGEEGHRKRSA